MLPMAKAENGSHPRDAAAAGVIAKTWVGVNGIVDFAAALPKRRDLRAIYSSAEPTITMKTIKVPTDHTAAAVRSQPLGR
jgi:hypothetical protein